MLTPYQQEDFLSLNIAERFVTENVIIFMIRFLLRVFSSVVISVRIINIGYKMSLPLGTGLSKG